MDRIDRTEHIRRTIEDMVSDIGADDFYRNNPLYHAQIYQLSYTLTMVDEVLENKGISKKIRDNILNECFTSVSEHTIAAIRLAKSESKLIALLSDWDK